MPQMAPYNWLSMFLLFNIIMIFTLSFNHYYLAPLPYNLMTSTKAPINYMYMWKW